MFLIPLNRSVRREVSDADRTAQRKAKALRKDLRLLATFVRIYCRHQHDAPKAPLRIDHPSMEALGGREVLLCGDCAKLLAHAFVKRTKCPYDPKPMCKKCPTHCYAPRYRAQIREVMKFSGRRLVLSGRLDYLVHLFF